MKKVYLFIMIGVAAMVLLVVSLMGFNPAVEKWSSLFAGAAIGFLVVGLPSVFAYFKNKRKNAK